MPLKVRKIVRHRWYASGQTQHHKKSLSAKMNISPVILLSVFRFLDLNDLTRAAGACYEWWCVIKRHGLMEWDWEELDLSGTGKLYCVIPLRAFRSLTCLNLASTQLSNHHFQQMMQTAINLERLDISDCPAVDQIAIFFEPKNLSVSYSISQFLGISSSQFWPSRVCAPSPNV